ncbi:MAG: hypothetical protein VB050_13275 [Geobacteraceae bacterium]|nr:hypothetical protein [Geobacteraceae bacterium]
MIDNVQQMSSSHSLKNRPPGLRIFANKKRRFLILACFLGIPLGVLLLLACLAIENEPLVVETSVPTVDSALRARKLARVVLETLNSRRETASIPASEEDLNALMTLVHRGAPAISGRIKVRPWILSAKVSLRLPDNPFGRYLNLQGELLPDQRGVNIDSMKIGMLDLPRPLARALLSGVLNMGLGNGEGTALIRSVQSVSVDDSTVAVNLQSVHQLKERLQRMQAFLSKMRDIARGGDAPWDNFQVSAYYARLLESDRNVRTPVPASLATYLGPLFRLARERSASGDPVRENRAALLALAIYLGDPRFEKLAGVILDPGLRDRVSNRPTANLGGRHDLCLHFVISVGLKLLTDQGVSAAVGEFKELLDAGRGGSGFSFVDLAADRAGIRFAEVATADDGEARRLQVLLSDNPGEHLFFPMVADLPENMIEGQFEKRYRSVDSRHYGEMVEGIDRRIDRCPAYERRH